MKTIMRHDPTNFTSPREGIPKDSEWLDRDASEIDAGYNILSEKLMASPRDSSSTSTKLVAQSTSTATR
jgi:hypothetical protein